MRLNLIIGILICIAGSLSAQIQVGVKASYGVSYTESVSKEYVNLDPVQIHTIATKTASPKKGIGLSLYADNDKLFFMTDAQYMTSARNFALQSVGASRTLLDPEVVYEARNTDLRLGVNAGLKYKNFKFGVGPEFLVGLTSQEDLSSISGISTGNDYLNAGFNFLVGYEFMNHVHVDLKHTYMFNDITNEFMYDGTPMDMKSNLKYLELSVGLYF